MSKLSQKTSGQKCEVTNLLTVRKPLRNQKVWRCPNRGVMQDKRLHLENSWKFCLTANHNLLLWATDSDVGGQPPNIEIIWFEGRFQPHISKRDMRTSPYIPNRWSGNEPWTPPLPIHGNRLGRKRACFGSQIVQECFDSVARKIFLHVFVSGWKCLVKDLPVAFQFLSYYSFKYCVTWRYWYVPVQALSSSI